jgi:hypothetical protein
MHMCMYVTVKYSRIHADMQSDTYRYAVRFSQIHADMHSLKNAYVRHVPVFKE